VDVTWSSQRVGSPTIRLTDVDAPVPTKVKSQVQHSTEMKADKNDRHMPDIVNE